jgi:acyl-CoA synthetase (NDP forming)
VLSRRPGRLALLAQSGAFGVALLTAADQLGLGVSQFVSIGNKADVGGNDLLLSWYDDPRTRVIGMYLESIGDPRRFARIARRVSRRKPILAVKSGRTDAGRRAGASHTAAAASPEVAIDALFRGSGVLRLRTMGQLLDAARVLTDQPLPVGPRLAIVGNSGGPEILAADAAADAGLLVEPFDEETTTALRAAGLPTQNPIDLGAAAQPETVDQVLRILLASRSVDMVLSVFTGIAVTDAADIRDAVVAAAATADKTTVAVEVGAPEVTVPVPGRPWSLPFFTFPEPAASALGVAVEYARLRARPEWTPARPADVDRAAARELVRVAVASGAGWLTPEQVDRLLHHYGITTCPQRLVADADSAVAAASEFGYPVALKLGEAGLHKSDIGGVRLGLADEAAVRAAVAELNVIRGGSTETLLLQAMQAPGTELIVGAVHDAQFGPLVMLGAGGVLTEVLGDRRFALAPVSEADADDLISSLRSSRLLDGYRGAPAASRTAVRDVVIRVAALVEDLPQIAELDLNPVVCRGDEVVAVDARIRVALPPYHPDPLVRQLRAPRAR